MLKKSYLGIASIMGISIGIYLRVKSQRVSDGISQSNDTLDLENQEQDAYISQVWTESEKSTPEYQKLLQKWGTKEGLINVRYPQKEDPKENTKKRLKRFKKIAQKGKELSKYFGVKTKQKHLQNTSVYQEYLTNNFEVTQVTITNNTDQIQKATLWGANAAIASQSDKVQIEEESFSVGSGIHPQSVVYNPANHLFYVVNQLSDSVTIIDAKGVLVRTIELGIGLIGGISPVDLVVNSVASSSNYGHVYIIGSVSNTLYQLNLQFEVVDTYNTGKRPVAVTFNTFNERVYIANLVSNSIAILDTQAGTQSTINDVPNPIAIKVHQGSGNLYVFSGMTNAVHIYDAEGKLLQQDINVATTRGQFGYHPLNNAMYFSISDQNSIIRFDDTSFEITTTIQVGIAPFAIAYNTIAETLYVANKTDQTFSILSNNNEVIETRNLGAFDNGLAISSNQDVVVFTSAQIQNIQLQNTKRIPVISFNEEYQEYRKDFQHNPAVLQHLRVINSGAQKLNSLQLVNKSVTGKEICTTYSFRNYDSPQNFSNVSELFDIKGAIIDGRNSWCLNVPANQKLTLLMYHKQFEVYDLLPETSRKSIGVQMSKGIPKQWK